jgi:hopanoid biosynthesis associated RND transporter like protein HpnN
VGLPSSSTLPACLFTKGTVLLKEDRLKLCCATFIRGLKRGAAPVIVLALLLAGLSVYYTLKHLVISTSRNDLVASNKHFIQLSDQMTKRFGGRDGLVVVVGNGTHQAEAVKFADALARELRRRPDCFTDLFYRLDPEVFKPWALLYLDQKDLLKIKDNILGQQAFLQGLAADPRVTTFYRLVNESFAQTMVGQLFTGFLEEQPAALPDVSLLNATLSQLEQNLAGKQSDVSPFAALFPKELSNLSEEGYFFTEDDKFLLFLVTPKSGGYTTVSEELGVLRGVVRQVKTQFPDLKVGVTGPDALEADEMDESLNDITLATWLSLLGQMGLLILFLRSLRRTFVEGLLLVIGLCWTFGMVTLVVGHLNLLSMIFAPLMLGLTIDYGIHWFCRLEEEENQQLHCTLETLACAFRQSLPGIVYAGLAAIVSFLPLAFVGFKGLAELGLILALGILIMLVATLLLGPSLVVVTERCTSSPHHCPGKPHPFLHLHWKNPGLVVALGGLIVLLGAVGLNYVKFDLNPLHLQNQKTESVVWENNLLRESKYSTSYGALATASLGELKARIEALKRLPTVSHVESVLSFLPADPEAKRPLLKAMQPVLSSIHFPGAPAGPANPRELAAILSRINFKLGEAARNLEEAPAAVKEPILTTHRLINRIMPLLDPERNPQAAARLAQFGRHFFTDLKDKWQLLQGYVNSGLESPPMTLANLPREVRQRFISPEGAFLLRVFPSQDIWNFGPLKQFVQGLWSVDPNAVGDPVLLYVFTLGFRNSILWAAGLALLAIAAMLVILFRSLKMALLALIPLLVGTALTVSLMWLLGLTFNQANVLFVPLILGEGIEFGIIILARWRLEESARAITLPASTAKGVALAALTTTVGFGSLMVSGHRGTFSLGLLATVGSLSVLLASLSILPAFLRLVERDRRQQPLFSPNLRPTRWFNHLTRKKPDEKTAGNL